MSVQTVNPKNGLREGWDDFYKVPLVHQRSIGALRFDGQQMATHTAPIGRGLTLDWYARFARSDELFVTFQGANKRETVRYPVFWRVKSMSNKASALMSFADPTLQLDPTKDMLLSWYLGGPGWDPLPLIVQAIRRAQGKTGAKHIAFVGGSGGGFAALRASAMIPGSMAFLQEPQTNVAAYIPSVVDKYFQTVWPGWDAAALLKAFPERFDMVRHYQTMRPLNYVYYAQSRGDVTHVDKHYTPFREAARVMTESGSTLNGDRTFALYDGEVAGHGKITPAEFDHHFASAVAGWRSYRDRR